MTQEKLQGGATGGVEDLYREVVLDHFRSPKNRGRVSNANAGSEGLNPLCGDQIMISALIEGDLIKDVKFEGHGCAISQSAASMMTDVVKGKSVVDAHDLSVVFKRMFGIDEEKSAAPRHNVDDLGDLVALEGVKKYPVRIKCALLSWNTLLETFSNFNKSRGHHNDQRPKNH